ncbi:ABC transporter substrate-binding protein [Streptomyces cyaneofuscatus]|uniref:ABC transporter substrate-binding protein n=1 Tax=Streptomyces TaxID=1883 RepID=UPI00136B5954|nr:ABC transporter substrate-binding protein [Streptomyces sp. SID2119]MYW32543.1 transporter substrate-binding domain-containing protein [Streptomyces sp. SID2119]
MTQPLRRLTRAAAVAVAGTLLLSGCGSDKIDGVPGPGSVTGESRAAVSADPELVAMVPPAIASKGTVTIAVDATYAPGEFKDASGRIVGFDIDLGDAVFTRLGLKTQWQAADFGSILGGLTAKKYDLSISAFTITRERVKTLDMVQYFVAGEAIAVLAGNPDKVPDSPDGLCGLTVAVQTNTVAADKIRNTINPACTKAGKPQIPNDGDQFPAQTDAINAVIAKRDQVLLADSPVIDYAIRQNGRLEKLGENHNIAPYGIALPKGTGLTRAVQAAVKALIEDGTYGRILDKWGVSSGAVSAAQVLVNKASR